MRAEQNASRRIQLRSLLRCPRCRGTLEDAPTGGFNCATCSVSFPDLDGRPALMTDATAAELSAHLVSSDGQQMVEEYQQATVNRGERALSKLLAFLRPPAIMHRYHPDLLTGPSARLFSRQQNGSSLILNVGGGPYRVSDQEITLNIGPFANVDLIADAHVMPLADNSFDAVFSLAVLEHVANPYQVVSEMIRVLKPGGYLYSELPFIFFFHGYPTDYTRFTREGVKRLFSALADAEVGMTHGPVSALLQSGNMVLQMLLPPRLRLLSKLANGAYRWVFFPFKYLDLLLRERPEAHILAGGFYVLGRKPYND